MSIGSRRAIAAAVAIADSRRRSASAGARRRRPRPPAARPKPRWSRTCSRTSRRSKGIGVDDFLLTMGIMSAAVGSDCVGCHPSAGTDHVDWALDTPRKRTARRMVQMVTAHQPRQLQRPAGRDLLDLPSRPRSAGDDADAGRRVRRRRTTMPTTCSRRRRACRRSIRCSTNICRRSAARRTSRASPASSRPARASAIEGSAAAASVEVSAQAPDKRATHISFPEYPDRGVSVRTYDGRTGWIATPLAVVPKYELARQRARRRANRCDARPSRRRSRTR